MSEARRIRVGLIGLGLSGKVFHAPLLTAHSGYEVMKVLSSRKNEVLNLFPQAQAVQKVDELTSDDSIDLIINCAPNEYHYSYSAAALEAGKHVVVEKPFVNTLAEGKELVELAQKKNRLLSVFHNRRWDADFLTIRKILQQGKLGEISLFESFFGRFRPVVDHGRWREAPGAGSGVFFDLAPHLIDQALCLFGRPDEVFADLELQRSGALTHDYFHVILKYQKMRVILKSSTLADNMPRFQIFGAKGNFIKYGLDPQEPMLKAGMKANDQNFGLENEDQYGTLMTISGEERNALRVVSERGNYLAYYDLLHKALTGAREMNPVSAESALEVMHVLEMCLESSSQGKVLKFN